MTALPTTTAAGDGEAATLAARLATRLGADVPVLAPGAEPGEAAGAPAAVIVDVAGPRRAEDAERAANGGPPVLDPAALEARWQAAGWAAAWRGAAPKEPTPADPAPVLVVRPESDDRADALLAAGAQGLLLDPGVDPPRTQRLDGVRIAIVTYELVGLTRTGGIGTAYTALAHALAEAGATVDVLFTGWPDEGVDVPGQIAAYAERGVRVHELPDAPAVRHQSRHARRAQEALDWLTARDPYPVVHVPECAGHGAAIVAARAAGTALDESTIVVGTHGPTRWVRELNAEGMGSEDLLALDALERRSVVHAEVVVSPSAYLLGDLQRRGWTPPARSFVQQLVLPPAARGTAEPSTSIDELVFFGRLETRKGFLLLCDALDRLVGRVRGKDLRVTFLGRAAAIDGVPGGAVLDERRAAWPWPVEHLDSLDQPEALAYLRGAGRLVVVPSTGDNLPLTVLEAVALGVPLLTTPTGGIPEIVDPRDHPRTLVAADPDALASAVERALTDPPPPPRFAVPPDANRDAHLRWHAGLARVEHEPRPPAAGDAAAVVVLGAEAAAPADAEHLLLRSPRHELDPQAPARLADVASRTGAAAVVFSVRDRAGRVVLPPGGPAALGALGPAFSTGSALVRADALGGMQPGDERELEQALVALALDGREPFVLPEALATERAPAPAPGPVTDFAGLLADPVKDLPGFARTAGELRRALERSDARVLELEEHFRTAARMLTEQEERYDELRNRRAVDLALRIAAWLARVRGR